MRQPFRRGTLIDANRIGQWASSFKTYKDAVSSVEITAWLNQFKSNHRDLAARVLDSVIFITNPQVGSCFQSLLESLPGWHKNESSRKGRWRFVAFGSSAGESGDTMLHRFRQANCLAGKKYDELFIYKRDLIDARLGPDDSVVFVDDFAGTGTQACTTWANEIQELLPESPNIYLILVVCNIHARKKVENETGLKVFSHVELTEGDNVFSPKCRFFKPEERRVLLKYCMRANAKFPKGYGNCGLLLAFYHNCPNCSIPVLHVNHPKWVGVFKRHG